MGIEKISLLQIGDIHLPDWAPNRNDIDIKQSEFSTQIISNLQTDSLSLILEHLRKTCRSGTIDAALMMGDFTTRGDTSKLSIATQVMSSLINDTRSDPQIPIYGVPGNHDVAKKDAVEKGEAGKFDAIADAFKDAGWPPPPIRAHLKYAISNPTRQSVDVYALNSSIGSWSKALYPDGMKDLVFGENDAPVGVGETSLLGTSVTPFANVADQVYEQLDTPYFLAKEIDAIYQSAQNAGRLALIVAHHNILPQYLPRISSFGEVLNAGYARQMFLRTGCPILYLHGHIHTDPIETVEAINSRSKLISISAPSLDLGYNIIHLFADDGDRFFAAKLDKVRADKPSLALSSTIISLTNDPKQLLRKDVSRFWQYINNEIPPADREFMSWREFREYSKAATVPENALEGVAVALICAGLADVENLEAAKDAWRIKLKAS